MKKITKSFIFQEIFLLHICFIVIFCFVGVFPLSGFSGADEYRIGEGDVLRIKVYDNQDLDSVARVSGSGNIQLPLLGNVNVSNLTVLEVGKKLESLLANGYLINPQVSVFIDEFRSKKAVILGMVNKPGLYELSGPITLLELISKAGGLSKEAGGTATIKGRDATDKEKKINLIDLASLLEGGDLSSNVLIQNNDTVIISKAGMCYVTGEVNKPDAYKVESGATVLKMITMAGGFTGKAAKSSVKLIRMVDGTKNEYNNINLDTKVEADDVILVPESFF